MWKLLQKIMTANHWGLLIWSVRHMQLCLFTIDEIISWIFNTLLQTLQFFEHFQLVWLFSNSLEELLVKTNKLNQHWRIVFMLHLLYLKHPVCNQVVLLFQILIQICSSTTASQFFVLCIDGQCFLQQMHVYQYRISVLVMTNLLQFFFRFQQALSVINALLELNKLIVMLNPSVV